MSLAYEIKKDSTHVIGFDGKNWLVGHVALPKTFLDPQRFPPGTYNCDFHENGRPIHFLHGYQSATGDFPEQIPLLDTQQVAKLHEKNIIPLWDASIAKGRAYSERPAPKTITSFEPLAENVNITDHLPPGAIEQLRQAYAAGKPIAVQYDPGSKQWSRLTRFEQRIEEESKKSTQNTPKPAPSSASHSTPKEAEEAGRSISHKFKDMHPEGKAAVIGGSVALAALIGYWAYKVKHREESNAIDAPAR